MPHDPNEPNVLFDRVAWRRHRERAACQGAVEFLHVETSERLLDRLDDIALSFPTILDLGVHGSALSNRLVVQSYVDCVVAADPSEGFLSRNPGVAVAADPELLPFAPYSFDLAISALVLHWVSDLPGALIQLRRALKPGGLLLAAMLGGSTLVELRTALAEAELAEEGGVSPRVSPTANLADAAALLQRAGFAMPVADLDTITVTYPDILTLMHDLRGMGETNALSMRRRSVLRRATLARAAAIYRERYSLPDGRIPATFELLFLAGWAPEPRRPKAPRPVPVMRPVR
ncbi:MAG TPA: methyltransferase domain-containing protein [Stellaceae bacterium]